MISIIPASIQGASESQKLTFLKVCERYCSGSRSKKQPKFDHLRSPNIDHPELVDNQG